MKRIRDLREDHDKLQKDIAKELGISQQYYSQYELGRYTMPLTCVAEGTGILLDNLHLIDK